MNFIYDLIQVLRTLIKNWLSPKTVNASADMSDHSTAQREIIDIGHPTDARSLEEQAFDTFIDDIFGDLIQGNLNASNTASNTAPQAVMGDGNYRAHVDFGYLSLMAPIETLQQEAKRYAELNDGANIFAAQDDNGWTLAHHIVIGAKVIPEHADILHHPNFDIDFNIQDNDGNTPIHLVAQNMDITSKTDVTQFKQLLDDAIDNRGFHQHTKNHQGHSVYDIFESKYKLWQEDDLLELEIARDYPSTIPPVKADALAAPVPVVVAVRDHSEQQSDHGTHAKTQLVQPVA